MQAAVKSGLILALSVAGSLLFLNTVLGQFRPNPGTITGRPPGPVGGVTGRPGYPGGAIGSGMPRGVTGGIHGAIGGTTNIGGPRPGFTGGAAGNVSGMRPGTLTGGMGAAGGITGGPNFGFTTVYTCPNCKREVGRGTSPPVSVNCCGKTYINGRSLTFGQSPVPQGPGMGGGPAIPPSQPFSPAPSTVFPPTDDGSTSTTSSGLSGMTLAIGVGVVLFGLVILGGVIVLIVQSQKGGAGGRRRRARGDY